MISNRSVRKISTAEYCHDRMGGRFADYLSDYDTTRRLEVLIDEFLKEFDLAGVHVLDVGCGLGFFSQRLVERGAKVTACDIGSTLVELTRRRAGCDGVEADVLRLEDFFCKETFDIVVSSECIEHTPDPALAIKQMMHVLKPGGMLVLSTPNICWAPVVKVATALKLRKFDGLENFSSWQGLRSLFAEGGLTVVAEKGLHLFPFQFPLHGLSRWCDEHMQWLRSSMINICICGRKM
jgi:2-polyprenyl-3-methyl-5-hydroxy-6-metoxy-1,4-benzoquinol methylase